MEPEKIIRLFGKLIDGICDHDFTAVEVAQSMDVDGLKEAFIKKLNLKYNPTVLRVFDKMPVINSTHLVLMHNAFPLQPWDNLSSLVERSQFFVLVVSSRTILPIRSEECTKHSLPSEPTQNKVIEAATETSNVSRVVWRQEEESALVMGLIKHRNTGYPWVLTLNSNKDKFHYSRTSESLRAKARSKKFREKYGSLLKLH